MKKKINFLLLTILWCLPLIYVQAEEKEDIANENISTITIIEDSSFKTEDTLNAEENIFGNAFYIGNNVISKSSVDGIGFLAGNNVTVEGEKEYLFTAGNNIYVKGNIKKDAFLVGNIIEITGSVNRDLFVAAASITIKGDITRKARIYASEVIIEGVIDKDVEIFADNLIIKEEATIGGTLKYNEEAITEISDKAFIATVKTYKTEKEASVSTMLKDYFLSFLNSYANLLVVALMLIYFVPRLFDKLKEKYNKLSVENYFKLFTKGFLFIIGIPFLILIFLSTYISTSLAIILIPIYIIMAYFSILFSGYVVGILIWTKLLKKEYSVYTVIMIGVVVIKILELIPFIGMFVSMSSLFIGLGIMVDCIWKGRQKA